MNEPYSSRLNHSSAILQMEQPAGWWRDAFPLGNGQLGAMPYGRLYEERVLLNHDLLWYEGIRPELPELSGLLKECRDLIESGHILEANELYTEAMEAQGKLGQCARYHPAADLCLRSTCETRFRDYSRTLDMSKGEARTNWKIRDEPQVRQTFVSRADGCVVLRQSGTEVSQREWTLSLELHEMADALDASGNKFTPSIEFEASVAESWLIGRGRYTDPVYEDAEYGIVARVVATGVEACVGVTEANLIRVVNGESFTVVAKIFVYEEGEAAIARIKNEISELSLDYDALLARHVAIHRPRFESCRVELDTAEESSSTTSNERLLLDAYSGQMSLELIQKMTDYGRYLLVTSSSRRSVPSNLQGIWNGDYEPPWDCFFMINENLLMNYWQALPSGLNREVLGVFNFFESHIEEYRENATKLYGCRGIFIPALSSPETGLLAHNGSWIANWISGAGWLCQLFYDYYLFTEDETFLVKRLLPFMREVALFYEDYFSYDAAGQVVISPSTSPENWPKEACAIDSPTAIHPRLTVNATMDVAIAKELLGNLLKHVGDYGLYEDQRERWECIYEGLPPYAINEDGAIREWLDQRFSDNYEHRHLSHIYPVFPGFEIDAKSHPNLFPAFKVAVEKRATVGLKDQTGWSLAHMANIHARMGDGEAAMECLETLVQTCVGKNFFTYHNDYRGAGITLDLKFGRSTPFQIDANMGLTSSIYEMLIHSKPGIIYLLPALPKILAAGRLRGMHTRAGVKVDMDWSDAGRRIELNLHSNKDKTIELVLPKIFEASSDSFEFEIKAGRAFQTVLEVKNGRLQNKVLQSDA